MSSKGSDIQKILKEIMEEVRASNINADQKEVNGVCDECGIEGKFLRSIDKDGNFNDDDDFWTCIDCSGW